MSASASPVPTPFLRRWWRRLYWLRRDWANLKRLDWWGPSVFAGFGGIGDELLATCFIRELCSRIGHPVTTLARYPELFLRNPDVGRLLPANPAIIATATTWGTDLRRPQEWQSDITDDRQSPPQRHILAEAALAGGLHGHIQLRPWLHLSAEELAAGRIANGPQIAIHSTGGAARYFFLNKVWGVANFKQVVDALAGRFQIIQLGSASDALLRGTIDRRGACTLRGSAAVLAASEFFIGQVGLLMHLARSVETRAVIVFGGREFPDQSGYPCNENLFSKPPCAPCWRKSKCDYGHVCMTQITPADVLAAVERLHPRVGQPLETDTVDL